MLVNSQIEEICHPWIYDLFPWQWLHQLEYLYPPECHCRIVFSAASCSVTDKQLACLYDLLKQKICPQAGILVLYLLWVVMSDLWESLTLIDGTLSGQLLELYSIPMQGYPYWSLSESDLPQGLLKDFNISLLSVNAKLYWPVIEYRNSSPECVLRIDFGQQGNDVDAPTKGCEWRWFSETVNCICYLKKLMHLWSWRFVGLFAAKWFFHEARKK